jgi:hypothetical protein
VVLRTTTVEMGSRVVGKLDVEGRGDWGRFDGGLGPVVTRISFEGERRQVVDRSHLPLFGKCIKDGAPGIFRSSFA